MVQRRASRWTQCRFSSYDSVSNIWANLGDRRIGVRNLGYVCFIILCMVLLQCHNVVHINITLAFRQNHTVADYHKYSFAPRHCPVEYAAPGIVFLSDIDTFRLAVCSLSHSKKP